MAGFVVEEVDDTLATGGKVCLALDATGVPHVTYPTGQLGLRHAARTAAGEWVRQDPSGGLVTIDDLSLDVDSSGDPHVVFRGPDGLIYGHRTQGQWAFEQVLTDAGLFVRGAMHGSVRVRRNSIDPVRKDTPVIAYHDLFRGGLAVAAKVAGTWRKNVSTIDNPDNPTLTVGLQPSLIIDEVDTPRIAYLQMIDRGAPQDPVHQVKLATFIAQPVIGEPGPGWATQMIDAEQTRRAFTSLASRIDLSAVTLVAYTEIPSNTLFAWVREPLVLPEPRRERVAESLTPGRAPSAAVDPSGRLHIAYTDGELKLASRDQTGRWTARTVDTADGWPALTFDRTGTALIAYGSGSKVKLARSTG